MATEELKYMNIAKGWLIIFVVMGHIGNDFLTDFLHCTMTFQMVVFYFICGYFTKINTSSFKELISTPSPETSRVMEGFSLLREILSISSI